MDYKRVLMLHYTNGMSGREIAEATGDGKTTVNEFLKRFRECEELSYPLSEEVTNDSSRKDCTARQESLPLLNCTETSILKKSAVHSPKRAKR